MKEYILAFLLCSTTGSIFSSGGWLAGSTCCSPAAAWAAWHQPVVGTSPSYTSLGSCVSPKQQSPRTVTRLPHSKPPKLEFQAFGPRLPNKVPHQVSPSAGTSVWPLRLQFYGVVSFRHSGLRFSVDFGLACRFRIWGHWLVKGGWLRFQHALPDSAADLFASRIASVPCALNG